MDDVAVPIYYVASRKLTEAQVAYVLRILQISPVTCVLVSSAHDIELARQFADEVICLDAGDVERYAAKLAPVLVIGDAEFLDVFYEDGTRESLVPDAYTN